VEGPLPVWAIALYQGVTVLSYTNSAVNPVLYAFLTDNFRRTVAESFQRKSRTATSSVVARGLAMAGSALYVSIQQPILLAPATAHKTHSAVNAASLSLCCEARSPGRGLPDDRIVFFCVVASPCVAAERGWCCSLSNLERDHRRHPPKSRLQSTQSRCHSMARSSTNRQ